MKICPIFLPLMQFVQKLNYGIILFIERTLESFHIIHSYDIIYCWLYVCFFFNLSKTDNKLQVSFMLYACKITQSIDIRSDTYMQTGYPFQIRATNKQASCDIENRTNWKHLIKDQFHSSTPKSRYKWMLINNLTKI